MKKTLVGLLVALLAAGVVIMPDAYADTKQEPEVKKKCVKILDNKTNKEVEKCRTMKIHKKHEGTKVPEPAKK